MSAIIQLNDVSLHLGHAPILHHADLIIGEGDVVALTGPNGSGKSALLRLICGFLTPDSGSVWIDPVYLSPRRTFPAEFGITIDGPAYLPGRTGRENLIELARIRKRIGGRDVDATMHRVGLDPALRQKVRDYSPGMKQKLSLAQALMERPQVLLLDEPFNALDSDSASRVKDILREENDLGTTILFTSHSARDVADLTETVYRIERLALTAVTGA